MRVNLTLYGQPAGRFEDIREELEEERGIEMSNAAVARELMARHG